MMCGSFTSGADNAPTGSAVIIATAPEISPQRYLRIAFQTRVSDR